MVMVISNGSSTLQGKIASVLTILVFLCSLNTACLDNAVNIPPSPSPSPIITTSPIVPHTSEELTYEEAQEMAKFWDDYFKPDLTVNVSVNQSPVAPGDHVSYYVNVSNIGTGKATSIELVDYFPDGTIERRNLRDLNPGDVISERFVYLVPKHIADGTVLKNWANVSGKNMKGDLDNETNNECLTSIIIHG
jgi:uncharacterized repeat protein (TIGR01451 family)